MTHRRLRTQTLNNLVARQLRNPELRLRFDERRFYLQIAHLLAELRAESGLTQAEVARRAGVSQPMVARLERGDQRRTPTFDTIHRLLAALGYSLELSIRPMRSRAA